MVAPDTWSPAQLVRDDQVDELDRHPDVVALRESAAHMFRLAGGRPRFQLEIDEFPAVIRWAVERASKRTDRVAGDVAVTLLTVQVGEVEALLTCATGRLP